MSPSSTRSCGPTVKRCRCVFFSHPSTEEERSELRAKLELFKALASTGETLKVRSEARTMELVYYVRLFTPCPDQASD